MSERGNFRGGGPRGRGGDRGGRGGGGGRSGASEQKERPKKENIIDLNRFMDKPLKIKFSGGREGEGLRCCVRAREMCG
jgi:U6 snRNA-associated Sm-like protein LSm7